jgi:hypothetical protein
MGNMSFFDAVVEKKLMDLHCGYIGRVVWTDGITAKVQPLGMIKQAGSNAAKAQAIVSDVPVACRYKFETKTLSYTTGSGEKATQTVAVPKQIDKGDLVACLCADRNIAAARRGKNEVPPAGRHSISDSIIVGIL